MNNIRIVQNAINEEINSETYSTNIICYDDVLESLTNLFYLLTNEKFILGFSQTDTAKIIHRTATILHEESAG